MRFSDGVRRRPRMPVGVAALRNLWRNDPRHLVEILRGLRADGFAGRRRRQSVDCP